MLERAKKRLLGFREPVDKDKKEEGDARAEGCERKSVLATTYVRTCRRTVALKILKYSPTSTWKFETWVCNGTENIERVRYRERWMHVDSETRRSSAYSVRR